MPVKSYLIPEEANNEPLTEKNSLRVRVKDFRLGHSVTWTKASSHPVWQQGDLSALINEVLLRLGKMTQAKVPGCGLIYGQHSVIHIQKLRQSFRTLARSDLSWNLLETLAYT